MNTRKLERETGVDRSAWRKLEGKAGAAELSSKERAEVLARRARLDDERLRKLTVQRELLEAELAHKRGELISRARVEADALAAGAAMSALARSFYLDLPGQLVGLTEREMSARIAAAVDVFITNFRLAMDRCAQPDSPAGPDC